MELEIKLSEKEYMRHQMTFSKPSSTGKFPSEVKESLSIYRPDENIRLYRTGQMPYKCIGSRSYQMTVASRGGGLIYIH